MPPTTTPRCSTCGSAAPSDGSKLLRCGRCKLVWYCNAACQKAAWPTHKRDCQTASEPRRNARADRRGALPTSQAAPSAPPPTPARRLDLQPTEPAAVRRLRADLVAALAETPPSRPRTRSAAQQLVARLQNLGRSPPAAGALANAQAVLDAGQGVAGAVAAHALRAAGFDTQALELFRAVTAFLDNGDALAAVELTRLGNELLDSCLLPRDRELHAPFIEEAARCLERAQALFRADRLTPTDALFECESLLLSALVGLERYEEAAAMQRRQLDTQLLLLGAGHSEVVRSQVQLSWFLEGASLWQEALEVSRAALKYPDVLRQQNKLYGVLKTACVSSIELKRYQEALPLCRRLVAVPLPRPAEPGLSHLGADCLVKCLAQMAYDDLQAGRLDDALRLLDEAETFVHAGHELSQVANFSYKHTVLWVADEMADERPEAALAALERFRRPSAPPDGVVTVQALALATFVLATLRRTDEVREEGLRTVRASMGVKVGDKGEALGLLAASKWLMRAGVPQCAVPLVWQGLRGLEALTGVAGRSLLLDEYFTAVESLKETKSCVEDALELAREGMQLQERVTGTASRDMARWRSAIGEVLTKLGRPEEALSLLSVSR